jgi:hypothetical protein
VRVFKLYRVFISFLLWVRVLSFWVRVRVSRVRVRVQVPWVGGKGIPSLSSEIPRGGMGKGMGPSPEKFTEMFSWELIPLSSTSKLLLYF